jgi:hypothetical protein
MIFIEYIWLQIQPYKLNIIKFKIGASIIC